MKQNKHSALFETSKVSLVVVVVVIVEISINLED